MVGFFFFYVPVFACIYVYVPRVWLIPGVGVGAEEGLRSPGTGGTDSSEPPHRCWDPNVGPLGGVCALSH